MIGQGFAGNRYYCGRVHRRPLHVWFLDHLGYHQEWLREMGTHREYKVWRWAIGPTRSYYTCRKRMDHWKLTIKPPGRKRVVQIHDRDFSEFWLETANKAGIRNRNTPFWRDKIKQRTREQDTVELPTEAWELGHHYVFTRWEKAWA